MREPLQTLKTVLIDLPYYLFFIVNALYERFVGWTAKLYIPYPLRGILIGQYAWRFNAKMEEAQEESFYAYPSFAAWFGRPLKKELRPISPADLVSPCDGEVFHVGQVKDSKIADVKGYDYDFHEFLGPVTVKTNPDMRMYHCTINLWPGNYHCFHSPTHFKIKEIVNIPGFELTAKPSILKWFPRILDRDERVVMAGEWKYGFFSMTAVAALSVGDIVVNTNPVDEVKEIIREEHRKLDEPLEFDSGDKVGEFRFGSTIVLIFEAPPRFNFRIERGDYVKYGQRIIDEFPQ
ncbi:Protein PSD-1 b [Aphelenchoides avenae]|nr:Protein PSD-1 b [Aphelenchus avenae]